MRIAVIGSGISGLASVHVLDDGHDVVLYEAAPRLGGHTNTVEVEDPFGPIGVDTGFIVHNERNYPNLVRLFDELGVATQPSEMSFGVHDATGFAYRATNIDSLLADRRNALRPRFWRMTADIVRFWRAARRVLDDGDDSISLEQFLERGRYSDAFVDLHLIPMGAAVWSADPRTFARFPALSLFRFLDNHGLLGLRDRPEWRTVVGGSRRYVEAITDRFGGEIRLSSPVQKVQRTPDAVEVTALGTTERFDRVVLACHTNQSLEVLADATPEEKDLLRSIAYQPNRATLHTDVTVLPRQRKAWAAWNYEVVEGSDRARLTYDLTCLQRLPGAERYLVSLNLDDRIDPDRVIASFDYEHPVFDRGAIDAQRRLDEVNRDNTVVLAGAWAGYGFHEDGMTSALSACRHLGVEW